MTAISGSCCPAGVGDCCDLEIYDLDWTEQPSQVVGADGPVIIDGIEWTAANVANSAVFEVANGIGLRISAASGVARTWETLQTAPGLYLPIVSLGALFADWEGPLTIWSYFSSIVVPNASNQIAGSTVWAPASAGYSNIVTGVGRLNSAGNVRTSLQRTTTHLVSDDPGLAAADVFVWRSRGNGTADFFVGSWAGDWPDWTALSPTGFDPGFGAGTGMSTDDLARRLASCLVYFSATRASSGDPRFVLSRTRVTLG